MRAFAAKCEVLAPGGDHVRFVPGRLAAAMVSGGTAAVANANGKVKSVRLVECAQTHAQRIGEPAASALLGTRFVVREQLDGGGVIWRHHPRATYPDPE